MSINKGFLFATFILNFNVGIDAFFNIDTRNKQQQKYAHCHEVESPATDTSRKQESASKVRQKILSNVQQQRSTWVTHICEQYAAQL
jgi:hypothetical protein